MGFSDLLNLFNVAEDSLGSFTKILIPLGIILLIILILKWFQSINKKTSPNITVIRGPS
tara:strand:- start:1104 stop:1280 length:177 start_codon:yes stop_codon:yes gene_type:complete